MRRSPEAAMSTPTHTTTACFLSPKDVSNILGIQRRTLFRWISEGAFPPPIRFNRRVVRWREEVVLAWAAEREKEGRR
jgi:prophage regulatory protein